MSSLFAYVLERRNWQLTIAFFWAALMPQFHLLAAVFWMLIAFAIALHRRRLCPRSLGAGLALFGMILLPFAISTASSLGQDSSALVRNTSAEWRWDFQAATRAFESIGVPGPYVLPQSSGAALYTLEGILFIVALIYATLRLCIALRAKQTRRAQVFGLLLIWLALPVALLSYHAAPVNGHYLLLIYPAQFILIGIFVGDVCFPAHQQRGLSPRALRRCLPMAIKVTVSSLLLLASIQQVLDVAGFLRSVQSGVFDDAYGLPLKYAKRAVDIAGATASPSDRPVLRVGGSRNDFAKPFSYLSGDKFEIQFVDGRSPLLLPADGAFVYAAISDSSPTAMLLDAAFPEGWLGPARSDVVWGIYAVDSSTADRVLRAMPLNPATYEFPNGVKLLGYQTPKTVRAGDTLPLRVVWQVPRAREHAPDGFSFFAHILDRQQRRNGGLDATPAPPSRPRRGDVVVQWLQLPLSVEATLGQYWIELGINQTTPAGEAPAGSRLRLGPVKVTGRDGLRRAADALVQTWQRATFEDQVELLGYDLSSKVAHPGESVHLRLHWLAVDPDSDFTVFVHVVDPAGRILSQADSQPIGGSYPTSIWGEDEYVADQYQIDLPADIASGEYRLLVGMYHPASGRRLQVLDGTGRVVADAVELGTRLSLQR